MLPRGETDLQAAHADLDDNLRNESQLFADTISDPALGA
jgi:hypothetical protein